MRACHLKSFEFWARDLVVVIIVNSFRFRPVTGNWIQRLVGRNVWTVPVLLCVLHAAMFSG
jgi:hypothetical protein